MSFEAWGEVLASPVRWWVTSQLLGWVTVRTYFLASETDTPRNELPFQLASFAGAVSLGYSLREASRMEKPRGAAAESARFAAGVCVAACVMIVALPWAPGNVRMLLLSGIHLALMVPFFSARRTGARSPGRWPLILAALLLIVQLSAVVRAVGSVAGGLHSGQSLGDVMAAEFVSPCVASVFADVVLTTAFWLVIAVPRDRRLSALCAAIVLSPGVVMALTGQHRLRGGRPDPVEGRFDVKI